MKIYYYLILVVCFAALNGCKADSPVNPVDTETVSLEVKTTIQSQQETRSMLFGEHFSHESKLRVVGFNAKSSTGGISEAIYVCKNPNGTAEAWAFANTAGIKLNADEIRIWACYPNIRSSTIEKDYFTPDVKTIQAIGDVTQYNSDNSFYTDFKKGGELKEVVMGNDEQDYMTGADALKPDGTKILRDKNNKEAELTMRHCLAIAVFHVKKTVTNTNPGIVKNIKIKNKDAVTGPLRKGKFAFEDNAFISSDVITYERTMDNFPDGCYYGLMVYPATMTGTDTEIELVVDEIIYTIDLPAKTWKSSTILLYEISLQPTKAQLMDEVKVYDWEIGDKHKFEID